jgi:hypothetical protein
MAYQKRHSAPLEKAQARLRGLQSIQAQIDLGGSLTLQDYANLIGTVDTRLQAYNWALAEADRHRIELDNTEAELNLLSSRVLTAVAAMYGKTSKEYEMAGAPPKKQETRD